MSTPLHAELSGSFTSAGTAVNLTLPCGYNDFELVNTSDVGSTASATPVMEARGTSLMAAGSAYVASKTNGAATVAITNTITSNGFTFVSDSGSQGPGALVSNITAISQAAGAVASTATPAPVGSVVRMINTAGMEQIAGMDFSVTAISAGVSMTLGYLDSSAFAAAGTTGNFRVIPFDPRYYPRRRTITGITQAASAVVQLSVTHQFSVGQLVRVIVPSAFGMQEISNQIATITAINTSTNTITLNINSSAFTAFAYPTSAVAALGVSQPLIVPVGEAASHPYENLLDDSTKNLSFSGVIIGTGVQTSGSTYQWFARNGVSI